MKATGIVRRVRGHRRSGVPTRKEERYMKATGIVRRVEECVIIGQTA